MILCDRGSDAALRLATSWYVEAAWGCLGLEPMRAKRAALKSAREWPS